MGRWGGGVVEWSGGLIRVPVCKGGGRVSHRVAEWRNGGVVKWRGGRVKSPPTAPCTGGVCAWMKWPTAAS